MDDSEAKVLIAACLARTALLPALRAFVETLLNEWVDAGLITAGPALRPHDTQEALVEATREPVVVRFAGACHEYIGGGDVPLYCGLPDAHAGACDPGAHR